MKIWQSKLNALTAVDLATADPWLSDFQLDLWARQRWPKLWLAAEATGATAATCALAHLVNELGVEWARAYRCVSVAQPGTLSEVTT